MTAQQIIGRCGLALSGMALISGCQNLVAPKIDGDLCWASETEAGLRALMFQQARTAIPAMAGVLNESEPALTVTLERTVANAIHRDIKRVDCSGTVRIDVPPALISRFGGRAQLTAPIVYSVQFSGNDNSAVYTTTGHELLVDALAASTMAQSPANSAIPSAVPQYTESRAAPVIEAAPVSDGAGARDVAYGFYAALGNADGLSASRLVVPEKRSKPAFRADNLTRFYASLREPLQIQSIQSIDRDTVRVNYSYMADTRFCNGSALMRTVVRNGERLINSIQTGGGC